MNEHDIVVINQDIDREGEYIPKDSEGAIISVHKNGEAYTVEFDGCKVITVYPNEIE